jgi:flagellar motor switch protein FliN/FliY
VPSSDDPQYWLLQEFCAHLAAVFETMTGERPAIEAQVPSAPPTGNALHWHQTWLGAPGDLWLIATEADWAAVGRRILLSAGLEDGDPDSIKSTYLETLGQALSGLAQALSGRLGREVTPAGGKEVSLSSSPSAIWSCAEMKLAPDAVTIYVGVEKTLLDAIAESGSASQLPEATTSTPIRPEDPPAPEKSRTFDLLLDVELPVSVSFGRAQVQLKDVLKLTTGSIVELNRSIAEPVEVIVNNCVIARGEVVVIEGNFGVRIQQVVSRQERLRTLH